MMTVTLFGHYSFGQLNSKPCVFFDTVKHTFQEVVYTLDSEML